jgi:hypothetical protein
MVFQRERISNKVLLRRQLQQMKFNPNLENMSEYLLRIDKLTRQPRGAGLTIYKGYDCIILLSLPPEYDMVATAIEMVPASEVNVPFVRNSLLEEESKRLNKKCSKGNQKEIFKWCLVQSNLEIVEPTVTVHVSKVSHIKVTKESFCINVRIAINMDINEVSVDSSQVTIMDSSNSGIRLIRVIPGVKIDTGGLRKTG